jgi:hypothetical protein
MKKTLIALSVLLLSNNVVYAVPGAGPAIGPAARAAAAAAAQQAAAKAAAAALVKAAATYPANVVMAGSMLGISQAYNTPNRSDLIAFGTYLTPGPALATIEATCKQYGLKKTTAAAMMLTLYKMTGATGISCAATVDMIISAATRSHFPTQTAQVCAANTAFDTAFYYTCN